MDTKIKDKLKHLSRYAQILLRCYDDTCDTYKSYGAKGVTVCEEWLNSFDSFEEWCNTNGYEEGLVLDKDVLCDELNIYPKVYSPQTCQFMTAKENNEYANKARKRQAVACYDDNGLLVASFRSASTAASELAKKSTGFGGNIRRVISGDSNRNKAFGYYWIDVVNELSAPLQIAIQKNIPAKMEIECFDSNNVSVGTYHSVKEVAIALNLKIHSINGVLNGHRKSVFGYTFNKKVL